LPGLDQLADVVPEFGEAALVNGAGRLPVDADIGISHRRADHDVDALGGPRGRDVERVLVLANAVGRGRGLPIIGIVIGAEALHLPIGGNGDGLPDTRLASTAHLEVPVHGAVAARAGEVLTLRRLRREC